jgi:hypothetical protein
MTKLVPTLLVAVALVAGGVAAAQLTADEGPEPRLSLASASVPGTTTAETTGTTGTTTGEDVSGPCDEAEHANDPRCTGAAGTAGATTTLPATGQDVSGPCDEAEHANDPRCTGAATTTTRGDDDRGGDDRRGSNRGPGGGGDDDDPADDRSGSNSGHGGGGDDD